MSDPITALAGRSLAPDLARGTMLLLIAVANAPWYLWGREKSQFGGHPIDVSGADAVAQSLALIVIDGRTYPMFAFLFGYGIVQLHRRQLGAGLTERQARALLRRRHLWMLVFGFAHAALLWMGDVIGAYGLAGLVLVALFLKRPEREVRVWASALTGAMVLVALLGLLGGAAALWAGADLGSFATPDPVADPNYITSVGMRVTEWFGIAVAQGLLLATPVAMLLAFVAARHRVLEEPERHLPLLRRTAIAGIAIGWASGAVLALQNLGVLGLPRSVDWAFLGVQTVSGLAAGLGYVAVFGLIAARLRDRPVGPAVGALRALGQRSLTCYLAQSVIFAPLMSAWGLGLGASLSSWSIALVAVGVWLLTLVLAVVLERARVRGPAEWLLRALAYR